MTLRPPLWKPILVAAAIALSVGAAGGALTDIGPWYRGLNKPWWNPADWVFPVAWSTLYALIATAGVLAWRFARSEGLRRRILALFLLNAALNVLWSALFFKLHRPDWALSEVLALWASVIVLIFRVSRASRPASWLLVPYAAWVSFAAYLNFWIVQANAPFA
jgi:tryptophan-rich sensory protein